MHLAVGQNMKGRDFVVGDIHGHYDLLNDELSYEGFDPDRDRLFSVGDLIDRGPKSAECLELLKETWFFTVRGNHEQMMIDCIKYHSFQNWRRNYGQWLNGISENEIHVWADRLDRLPIAITLDCGHFDVGICHAETSGLDWNKMINDTDCYQQMMWGRKVLRGEVDPGLVKGVDFTVHGHTPIPRPRRIENRFFIDTGAGDGDRLTVRNVAQLFQEYSDFKAFTC